MLPPPPTSTLFPYTTLFRSAACPFPLILDEFGICIHRLTLFSYQVQAWLNKTNGMTASSPCFDRSEEHTSELQSRFDLVCRLLLEKKNKLHSCILYKKRILN